ncbi:MAG: geranylgeranyl reductase family protein [Deltaproteobacteria bacterium]|nr:geranylgeranyl reductase family protein [Deltaproteobacteria bacterium]
MVEQQPIEELQETGWDVIVAGAGPAGSVAAGYLAGKGHKTLLLDKETFPREKVCGDGLSHDSIRFLKKIGLYETVQWAGHEVQMARAHSTSEMTLEVPGPYITLRRRHFDSLLAKRAVEAGAIFCCGKIVRFYVEGENIRAVHVDGLGKPLHARYVILSTGAQIGLAKSLRLIDRAFPSAVATRCYVASKEKLDCLVGSCVRPVLPGYGWVFPMGDDLYNVGVIAFYTKGRKSGLGLNKRFDEFVKVFPPAQKVMRSGKMVSNLVAAPLRCGLPESVVPGKGNLIATGETIGSTFNFTGEGIGKAMETGELAAKIIHDALSHEKTDVVRRFKKALDLTLRPKYVGYVTAERCMSKAWLNDFIASGVLKNSYLRQAVLDMTVRELDPRKAFSLGGIMKSLWS